MKKKEHKNMKNLKDYQKFKLDGDDILLEARTRCMKEMYERAQPSANYDDILEGYRKAVEAGKKPESVYERYYLSQEEFKYILEKYIKAYHIEEQFREDCDIIIRDMEEGCIRDKYIEEYTDENGNLHPGHRGYEDVSKLSEQIGEEHANLVIDFLKERRDFYRFDRDESRFRFDICLGDSPNSNEEKVKEYWRAQGIELEIDPRHYTENDFWCEENGCFDEVIC